MGTTIFGDSYRSGTIPVKKVEFIDHMKGEEKEYPPLRSVEVTWDDGTTMKTDMAAGLSDEKIKDYYAIGKEFNVGDGPRDLMKKVKKVEILR